MTTNIERLTDFPDSFVVQEPNRRHWFRYMMIALGLAFLVLSCCYLVMPANYYPKAVEVDPLLVKKTVQQGILMSLIGFVVISLYQAWYGRKDVIAVAFDKDTITASIRNKQTKIYKLDELSGFSVMKEFKHGRDPINPVSVADFTAVGGFALAPQSIYGFLLHPKDTKKSAISLPLFDPLNYPRMLVWLHRHLADLTPAEKTFKFGTLHISAYELRTSLAPLLLVLLFVAAVLGSYPMFKKNRDFLCELDNLRVSAQTDEISPDYCGNSYDYYSFAWDLFTQKQILMTK